MGSGIPAPEKYSVASQTDSATPASTSDVSMCCPWPVLVRWKSATTMPDSAKSPAPRSVTGIPALAGDRPGSPVIDMMPDTPWATRSKPPFLAEGPVWPYPEIDA